MQIKPESFSSNELYSKLGECDFIIFFNEHQSYSCHFDILAAASLTIRELEKDGNHPSQIKLNSRYKLNYLEDVINFFYGSKLTINSDNVKELIQIAYTLKSPMLLREVMPLYIFYQKREKVEEELKLAQNLSMVNPTSIQFAAQFFQWFISDTTFISQIHESILCQLISHPYCRIESEDYLLEKLITAQAPISAFQRIHYEFITPKGYKKLFEYFNPIDLKEKFPDAIYEILKERFSFSTNDDPSNNPRFISSDSFRELIFEYVSPKIHEPTPTSFKPFFYE